ncbi:MAG: phosphoribosyl-AMP cyclohydrolase [Alphaproteobacteria bacterium]
MNNQQIDETLICSPRFDQNGLIPCIAIDDKSGDVLMLAYMNKESLQKTLETREAHYWSRSRQELWHKGATSGNVQSVVRLQIDCDQDCILMHVNMPQQNGEIAACHTGRKSCFYRDIIWKDGEMQLTKSQD